MCNKIPQFTLLFNKIPFEIVVYYYLFIHRQKSFLPQKNRLFTKKIIGDINNNFLCVLYNRDPQYSDPIKRSHIVKDLF